MTPAEEALTASLAAALNVLLERGFRVPFRFVCLATNGSVVAGTYREAEDGLDCDITVEHFVDGVFRMPSNCMYVDADGQVARIVVDADGRVRRVAVDPERQPLHEEKN